MSISPQDTRLQKIGFCKLVGENIEFYAKKYEINIGRKTKGGNLDIVIGEQMLPFTLLLCISRVVDLRHPKLSDWLRTNPNQYTCILLGSYSPDEIISSLQIGLWNIETAAGDANISRHHATIAYSFEKRKFVKS